MAARGMCAKRKKTRDDAMQNRERPPQTQRRQPGKTDYGLVAPRLFSRAVAKRCKRCHENGPAGFVRRAAGPSLRVSNAIRESAGYVAPEASYRTPRRAALAEGVRLSTPQKRRCGSHRVNWPWVQTWQDQDPRAIGLPASGWPRLSTMTAPPLTTTTAVSRFQ